MLRIISSMLTFLCSVSIFAKTPSTHFVLPVEVLESQNVRFALPCGSEFKGWLLTRKLEIGAIIERSIITCSALPVVLTKQHLFTGKTFKALSIYEAKRVKLRTVQSVTGNGGGVVATYESSCNKTIGEAFFPKNSTIEVALADLPRTEEAKVPCKRELKRRILLADREKHYRYQPYSPHGIEYSFRVVPAVALDRYLKFKRECNESPVGMTLTSGGLPFQVGVLLARYPSFQCTQSVPGVLDDQLDVPSAVKLPSPSDLEPLNKTYALGKVLPQPVTEISKTLDRYGANALTVCDRTTLVYSEDRYHNLAVGSLPLRNGDCKAQAAKIALPFISETLAGIYPLRLSGFN